MQDHYSINLAKLWKADQFGERCHHIAAIKLNDSFTEAEAVSAFREFRDRFPHSEGYRVRLTKWESRGREIPVDRGTLAAILPGE